MTSGLLGQARAGAGQCMRNFWKHINYSAGWGLKKVAKLYRNIFYGTTESHNCSEF